MKYCRVFPTLLSSHVPTIAEKETNMKMERPPRNYIKDSSSSLPFSFPIILAKKPWLQGSLF